ncbi:hypothetical protein ACHAWF_010611 [Thalassiosira exigua]
MTLEALGAGRPSFETEPTYRGLARKKQTGFESDVTFYCRGVPVRASSADLRYGDGERVPSRSKAQAEGRALLAALSPGSSLADLVGPAAVEELRERIDASPAGHVTPLRVSPLPDAAFDALARAMGSKEEAEERSTAHRVRKEEYEQHFRARRLLRWERKKGGAFESLKQGEEERDGINEAFAEEERKREATAVEDPEGTLGKMKSVRDKLPIKNIRAELLEALQERQVVVVSGGTGSGKSTQCPQYILEDAIARGRGSRTRMVVTQPRRIAAISVAERVAAERDDPIGNSIGYTVRFRRKPPREAGGSVEFVTTGVLLNRLVRDPSLSGVSHVVVDEVHERDVDTDFLLVLLRDLLTSRPDLRVVLMSATLNAESFGKYFSNGGDVEVPVLSVPTKPLHPVDVHYLEDMAQEGDGADFASESASPTVDDGIPPDVRDLARTLLSLHDRQLQLEYEEAMAEEVAAARLEKRSIAEDAGGIVDSDSDSDDSEDSESDEDSEQSSLSPRLEALRRAASLRGVGTSARDRSDAATSAKLFNTPNAREVGEMTTRLVTKLAEHLTREETGAGRKGSILCFLPGLDEIKDAMNIIEEESDPSLRDKMTVLPLHSSIPQDDQQKVFIPAGEGKIKVIFATNIAESSVTIDDVLAVIDGGQVREMNWDAERSMSNMVTVPTSKSSATQRLGRAGRVAPGKCYRIYSRGQHAAMPERPMPEIQRTALEATCLNTCTLTDGKVGDFLKQAMDPPGDDAVAHSIERLRMLGAISVDPSPAGGEELTPLGTCVSRLPLDPAIGRMLIMGCCLQCLDPVLTAAACFSSREVFFNPPGMREEQRKARQAFSEESDLVASISAYNVYQEILQDEGWDVARQWAADNFISIAALSSIHSVRSQLLNNLRRIEMVDDSDFVNPRSRNKELRPDALANRNSGSSQLLHSAVWSCGLPDNLAARRRLGHFGTLRTRIENHAELHPSSVAFHRKPPKDVKPSELPPWFFYREMVLSSQVFLRGCTALEPEQILLFGGYSLDDPTKNLESMSHTSGQDEQNLLSSGDSPDDPTDLLDLLSGDNDPQPDPSRTTAVPTGSNDTPPGRSRAKRVLDDWIIVDSPCEDTLEILSAARREIEMALDFKVMNPRMPLPDGQQEIIDSVRTCFDVLDGSEYSEEN